MKQFFLKHNRLYQFKRFIKMLLFIYVIDPVNMILFIHQIMTLLLTVWLIFSISVTEIFDVILFDLKTSGSHIGITCLSYFCVINMVAELLIELNTAIYANGTLNKSKPFIIKNKLKSIQFYFDIVSFMAIIQPEYCAFVIFLKLFKIGDYIKCIEQQLISSELTNNIFRFIYILKSIIIISHLFCCIWCRLGIHLQDNNKTNWIDNNSLDGISWDILYLRGIYFIIVTMFTVGYGDITIDHNLEIIFIIILIIIGCSFFGFIIEAIGSTLRQIESKKQIIREQVQVMNNYMKQKQISASLRMKIQYFLEYKEIQAKTWEDQKEKEIISTLTTSLKEELMFEANNKVFKQSLPIFAKIFSDEFINKLSFCFEQCSYMPGTILFNQGDFHNLCIYIIESGNVELYINHGTKKTVMVNLTNGQSFGEMSLLQNVARALTAECKDYTTIYKLNKERFLDTLKQFDQDYQRYYEIKHELETNQKLYPKYNQLLNIYCYLCKSNKHQSFNCPLIHHTPFKSQIINRFTYSPFQNRDYNFIRKSQKTRKAFSLQKQAFLNSCKKKLIIRHYFKWYDYLIQDELLRLQIEENQEEELPSINQARNQKNKKDFRAKHEQWKENQLTSSMDSLNLSQGLPNFVTKLGAKKGTTEMSEQEKLQPSNLQQYVTSSTNNNEQKKKFQQQFQIPVPTKKKKKKIQCEKCIHTKKLLKQATQKLTFSPDKNISKPFSEYMKLLKISRKLRLSMEQPKNIIELDEFENNFERVKRYSNYFNFSNIDEILKKYHKYYQRRIRRKKKGRTIPKKRFS